MGPQRTVKGIRDTRQQTGPYATPPATPNDKKAKTKGKTHEDKDNEQRMGKAFELLLELREGTIIGIGEKVRASCLSVREDTLKHVLQRKEAEIEQMKEWIEEHRGQVTCPTCKQLFVSPQLLDCGHHFCGECLNEAKVKQTRNASWKGEPLVCPDEGCKATVAFGPVLDRKLEAIAQRFSREMEWKLREEPGVIYWPTLSIILDYDVARQRKRNEEIEAGMGLN
ncbi:hypothetical protein PM082_012148 [Marasmius tenuissimus]|nr:hypothetical protein PM082_012148 [Marasmius tenuissimus]